MTYEELFSQLSEFLDVTPDKEKSLRAYADFLKKKNQEMNLTSITSDEDMVVKHFYDSLYPLKFCEIHGKKCLDFGSGAGFPGLPIAIFEPNTHVDLLDSTAKKCHFLNEVATLLPLTNIAVINARGEDLPKGNYDVAFARAVAPLPILLELIAPLLKPHGVFLSLKGKGVKEELSHSKRAMRLLGLSIKRCEEYELPEGKGARAVIVFEKTGTTPRRYPRPYAEIVSHPL